MAVKVLALLSYAVFMIFIGGLSCRLVYWFCAPVTSGTGSAFPGDFPGKTLLRVLNEFFFFFSLLKKNPVLWALSISFHYSLLLVMLDHLRFLVYPDVPEWLKIVHSVEPIPGAVMVVSLLVLLMRRFAIVHHLYISTAEEYFVLLLLLAIGGSGLSMKYCLPVDLLAVKDFILHLTRLSTSPAAPDVRFPAVIFVIHYGLVIVLLSIFPFGKLVHGLGILFSPVLCHLHSLKKGRRSARGSSGSLNRIGISVSKAIILLSLLVFLVAGASLLLGWSPFPPPVPRPARNGTGPYALRIEKKRDLAPLYHNPQEHWKLWHGEGISRKDYDERECMKCHSAVNHCNRCHDYLGVKSIKEKAQ